MAASRKPIILGRYAIYFRSLSDAIVELRRAFFGGNRATSARWTDLLYTKGKKPTDTAAASGQPHESESESELEEADIEKLENVVEKAQNVLIKSSAVFPFDMFPDSIVLDRQKLTVVHRFFFTAKRTVSIQYSDIKNIQADVGPFLGSLTVTSEHFINNTQTIKYLPKKDVLAIQQLVQGFIIAHNEDVDLSRIDDDKLVELLNQLGCGEASEKVAVPGDN